MDFSLIETRYSETKVLEPAGRFMTVLIDGYLFFMSPDGRREYFIADGIRIKLGNKVKMIHFSPGGQYMAVASGLIVSVYDVSAISRALFEGATSTMSDIVVDMVYAPGVGQQLPDGAYVSKVKFNPTVEYINTEITVPKFEEQGLNPIRSVEIYFK